MHEWGSWTISHEAKPDYFTFVEDHRESIQSIPQYQSWLKTLEADSVVSKQVNTLVGTRGSALHRSDWTYLSWFLARQLSAGLRFQPTAFDKAYLDLEGFLYDDLVTLRAFSPLRNFECSVPEVDLGNGLTIRKIRREELEGLLDRDLFSTFSHMQIPRLRFAAEFIFKTEKRVGALPKEPPPRFEESVVFGKLVTALRLFKSGNVGIDLTVLSPAYENPSLMETMSGGLEHRFWWKPLYHLSEDEIEGFRAFWGFFSGLDLDQWIPLRIAVSRFNDGYGRDRPQDKLIDYMIAFESLLSRKDEGGAFRHKLAVRTARLLERDLKKRKQILKKMHDFYEKRSKLVHGKKVTVGRSFVEVVEDYLRRSIKQFLDRLQTENHDGIITHLDLD